MALSSVTCSPDIPVRAYRSRNGGTEITSIGLSIAPVTKADANALIAVAFVATNTTVTINPQGEDSVSITNGTINTCCCINGQNMLTGNMVVASARRLGGTTAAIAAQTVILSIGGVEIGRFAVAPAAISANPVCGFHYYFSPAADARMDLVANNLVLTVTAAEPSLQIFVEILGRA